jgi:hypothetical protein
MKRNVVYKKGSGEDIDRKQERKNGHDKETVEGQCPRGE